MAGTGKSGEYPEKISTFLSDKINFVKDTFGPESSEYRALSLQYIKQSFENIKTEEHNRRHWEADVIANIGENIETLHGMERLYNRTLCVEPTMICSCHCRYCLRGNYDIFTLSKKELAAIANYCGNFGKATGIDEILITGGDPLIVPDLLNYFINCIIELAPNIKVIRIATRMITHDPDRIGNTFFNILKQANKELRFEIATQINHGVEFFPETISVIYKIRELGATIYAQNVLLKGVNDDLNALVDLYNKMRVYGVDPHYLFHCVPLKGMHHFRTTVNKGLELIKGMVNSGYMSGRSKPMYALMTDVGKVTLYEDSIITKVNNFLILQTNYKYKERMEWNPSWILPETASVDDNGYIIVKYLDGDEN